MSIKVNTTDGTFVEEDANATILDKVINGATSLFAADDIFHSTTELRYTAAVVGSASAVAAGIYTRGRAERNEAPFWGRLF